MTNIVPIPTTRVGDYFVRQRLVAQTQSDQVDLFKLQSEISTGQRLQLPSDDAPAALRAISLQRLLAQKTQIQTNVASNTTVLTAADSTLTQVSGVLNDVLGEAISNADNTVTADQRQSAATDIDRYLDTLLGLANAKSAGQYLFSGSKTQVQPYTYNGQYVQYNGNEGASPTYVDLNRLLNASIPGTEAFGGVSAQAQGTALAPQTSNDTILSTINNGAGIDKNPAITISINTGSSSVSSVIDLSKAVTLGDVARLIEQGAPAGTSIKASVTGSGLTLSTSSGSLVVGEVSEGKTANELGIATVKGSAPASAITGNPLNPTIGKTTSLDSLLGKKAQAVLQSTGSNNDIVLTAAKNGVDFNDVNVVFANDGTAGAETATYDDSDPANKTLTVHIQSGSSTAAGVAAAINTQGTFQATIDYHDRASASQSGAGVVFANTFADATSGGGGAALDTSSGLIISNGGKTATIDTSGAKTVEDLLNEINGSGLGLSAEINSDNTGINVHSTLSGTGLTIGENGGQLASQLGIRTYTLDTKLSDFNGGIGAQASGSLQQLDASKLDSLTIVARDGTTLNVPLTGVTSLQGVADAINNATGNNSGTTAVTASLSVNGDRLELVDSSTSATGSLVVTAPAGNQAAQYLGLVPADATQNSSTNVDATGNSTLSGTNVLGNDLVITARDGAKLYVDIGDAKTVKDVIDRINGNSANNSGTTKVVAQLATTGNGIQLVDESTATTGALTVESAEGSQAAEFLGFVPSGQTQATSTSGSGGNYVLQSADTHAVQSDGVFNTLLNLKHALESNDTEGIGRAVTSLKADISQVALARSDTGSRLQSLGDITDSLQDQNVQIKSSLSDDLDVDMVQAISDLTGRQYSLQASLQTAASLLQLSLLNYI